MNNPFKRTIKDVFAVTPVSTTIMPDGRRILMCWAALGNAAFAGRKEFGTLAEACAYAGELLKQKEKLAACHHDAVTINHVITGFKPRKRTPESVYEELSYLPVGE